jgi:DNA modification methylase
MGTGTTAIAAMKHNRNAVGIDKDGTFLKIARERVTNVRYCAHSRLTADIAPCPKSATNCVAL